MEKDRIREIIQSEIQKAAVDVARNKVPKPQPKKEETREEKIIRQAEAHNALFYAFEDEDTINNSKQRYLKEEEDATTKSNKSIPSSMVNQAETEFRQNVNPKTTFDKQKNGRSIYALNDNEGLEVIMSGAIKLSSDDTIRWTFSIKNGPSIIVQSELNDDFVNSITKMNSYYISWKKKWQDYLSMDQNV